MQIHKHEFDIRDDIFLDVVGPAQILSGISQKKNHISIYFLVTPGKPKKTVQLKIRGTGHTITCARKHLFTIEDKDGYHVWHVFLVGEEP